MKRRFSEIYSTNEWLFGSGEGSLPVHTHGYVSFVSRFLRTHRIGSVLDLGCGDWQFSQFIDWSGIQYTGVDVVDDIVASNRARFSEPHLSFEVRDAATENLPPADLLIAKDVLQHWSHRAIFGFLPQLAKYQYTLITNSVHPYLVVPNADIEDGGFHYLDLRLPPFGLKARRVFSFTDFRSWWLRPFRKHRWLKHVLLVEGAVRP